MRPILSILLALLTLPLAASAQHKAGDFDYYVLALSWSPTWCALTGDARVAAQCEADHGWILHGLWPQYDRGWPDHCDTPHPPPSRALNRTMADIMGSAGLAAHQWRKHGSCTGLPAARYHALARDAYQRVTRPATLRRMSAPTRLPARAVERAFLDANPGWTADMLTITCRAGRIAEARLCLDRDLEPRACSADVARDCPLTDALMTPVR
jgi:ribonuclease T2